MTGCDRLVIGADGGGSWHHAGALCELRLWCVARTAAQIQANMDRRITGAEQRLIASYALDSHQGGVVADRSGNGRNGTLRGTSAIVPAPATLLRQ